jgi:hypothetical protein
MCHAQLSGDGSCLYDIMCDLLEPHGAKGATLCGKPQHYKWDRVSGNLSKA